MAADKRIFHPIIRDIDTLERVIREDTVDETPKDNCVAFKQYLKAKGYPDNSNKHVPKGPLMALISFGTEETTYHIDL